MGTIRTKHPLYRTWVAMRQRARRSGFAVAPPWADFDRFASDMGPRPPGTELVMARPSAGYAPDNCHWGFRKAPVTIEGIALPAGQWAKRLGFPARLISDRMALGMSAEEAVLRPIGPNRRSRHDSRFAVRACGPGGEKLSSDWATFREALEAWRLGRAEACAAGLRWEIIRLTRRGEVVVVMA